MKWDEVFCHTFKTVGQGIGLDVQMVEGCLVCKPLDQDDPRYNTDFILPSMKMVEACRADAFDFFQPFIAAGKLTEEQMHRASERYHLGKTRSGQPVFWMIDDMLTPLDAHIGNAWISTLLKKREPLLQYWCPTHCLFGQHLLNDNADSKVGSGIPFENVLARRPSSCGARLAACHRRDARMFSERNTTALRAKYPNRTVSIVESEASAVVLSELFPETVWMAYATTAHLTPDLFAPLEGRTVTLYPRTDPTLSTFLFFEDLADLTRRQYNIDLTVDTTLEDHATASQKERGVDILEFLIDNL
ncbi:MAG: hypothetical protein IK075_05035 [Prevotella sp.]|nr:hypothetical protein [Prevotella sp.]